MMPISVVSPTQGRAPNSYADAMSSTNTFSPDSAISPFASPGETDYLSATATFNLAAPFNPVGALTARTTEDAVEAVLAAGRLGLPLYVTSTGHASGAVVGADSGLLVRTSFTGQVTVDTKTNSARIPAGTVWSDVVVAANAVGLAALHGSSGTVGAVGYLMRGGMSFYGRRFGLGANSLLAVTLVLADGSVVRASASENTDLFWAVRGGGNGFGIVTEVEIQLYPMAKIVTGATFWDAKHAAKLLPLWRKWTESADERVSTSMRLMSFPAMPGVPEIFTNGQVLMLDGAVAAEHEGDLESALQLLSELVEPLAELAEPLLDTWHVAQPTDLPDTHMDPQDPIPGGADHFLLREIDDSTIEKIVEGAGPDSGSPLVIAELRQLGGAFSRSPEGGGALGRLDARYAFLAIWLNVPELAEVGRQYADALRESLAPWNTGFVAPTFVESSHQPYRAFDDATASGVDAIRRGVDPHGLFRGNVSPVSA